MSDAERQSPRTAIRNWLQVTDCNTAARPSDAPRELLKIEQASRSFHPGQKPSTSHPLTNQDQYDKRNGHKQHGHKNNGTRQKRITDKSTLVEPIQAQRRRQPKDTTVKSSSLGLAERLGLHAPFRVFKEHNDEDINEAQHHSRKRRRGRSTTSTDLRPPAANDPVNNKHDRPSFLTTTRPAKMQPALNNRDENSPPTASQGSDMNLQSPEKLAQSYKRRPRHKTRLDRYEFKGNDGRSKKPEQAMERDQGKKKQKKHKRKEKSGAPLMHDFAAQNVAHDRLTVSCPSCPLVRRHLRLKMDGS